MAAAQRMQKLELQPPASCGTALSQQHHTAAKAPTEQQKVEAAAVAFVDRMQELGKQLNNERRRGPLLTLKGERHTGTHFMQQLLAQTAPLEPQAVLELMVTMARTALMEVQVHLLQCKQSGLDPTSIHPTH